ncbi:PREDICTED: uncharacterized protein LOC106804678 [Priapulus caudatus]|uniref:Uncharacterized protein LOC106804678 n=1 Tax=Priapulus caudatus TaxID=37621 RepID=A0ABM1DNC2_PRICU|nr:PREDICTED: uncharacterized protein LOC106804678 [Priapulus caudatus]
MPEELDNVQEFGATQTVQAVTRAYVRLRDSGTPLGVAARWMECGLSAVKQLTRPAVDVVRSAKLLSAVDAMAVKYLNVGGVVASKSSEYLDGARRSVSGRVRRYCISVLRSRVGRAATAALDWCVAVCEAAVDALEIEQTPASEQNEKVAGADVCRGVSIRIKSAGPRLVIWVAAPLKLLVQLLRSGRHQLKEYVFQYHRSPSKRAAIRRRNRVTPKKRLASPPYNSFIWLSLYLPNKLINFVRVYVSTSPTKPVFKSYLTSPSKQDGNPAMEPLLSDGDHDKKRKFDDITGRKR